MDVSNSDQLLFRGWAIMMAEMTIPSCSLLIKRHATRRDCRKQAIRAASLM